MLKKFVSVFLIIIMSVLFASANTIYLTQEELSAYNGQNGQPAYIAYQNFIYDVSGVFQNGTYNGLTAGTDATLETSASDIVKNLQKIGTLVRSFTRAEVSVFDGKQGRRAYFIVDRLVYDATNSPQWRFGSHGGVTAGQDGTAKIARSPHGLRVLQRLSVIGKVED